MAMIKCKECGGDLSSIAKACPACGAPPPPPKRKPLLTKSTLVIVLVLTAVVQLINKNKEENPPKPSMLYVNKPVRTTRFTLVCPTAIFDNPRAGYGAEIYMDIANTIFGRKDKERKYGCGWYDGGLTAYDPTIITAPDNTKFIAFSVGGFKDHDVFSLPSYLENVPDNTTESEKTNSSTNDSPVPTAEPLIFAPQQANEQATTVSPNQTPQDKPAEHTQSGLPQNVGECKESAIHEIGTRLEQVPGSGSSVTFENGGYQVSYGTIEAVDNSIIGDRVTICLVSLPTGCPPGYDRGRTYKTTNLRTRMSWTLPDSTHECDGA